MEHDQAPDKPNTARRSPWNNGKLIGPKPPLRPSHIWSLWAKLRMTGRSATLRCSTSPSTADFVDATWSPCVSTTWRQAAIRDKGFAELADLADDLYRRNVQIGELNALNACMAIIRYKQLRRFYFGGSPWFNLLLELGELKTFPEVPV